MGATRSLGRVTLWVLAGLALLAGAAAWWAMQGNASSLPGFAESRDLESQAARRTSSLSAEPETAERSAVETTPSTAPAAQIANLEGPALVGRVLCDDILLREAVTVYVGGSRASTGGRARLSEDGSFQVQGIEPGACSVIVRTPDVLCAVFEDIEIDSEKPTRDPRLDPLDLRERFRLLRARVLRPDREPLAGESVSIVAWARFATEQSVEIRWGASGSFDLDVQGRFARTVPKTADRFLLDVPYYQSAYLEWDAAEQTIVLEPPIELSLDLDASSMPVAVLIALQLDRAGEAAPDLPAERLDRVVGDDGLVELTLELPGRFRVSWRVLGTIPSLLVQGKPPEIDVFASPQRQHVTCAFDRATLDAIRAAAE